VVIIYYNGCSFPNIWYNNGECLREIIPKWPNHSGWWNLDTWGFLSSVGGPLIVIQVIDDHEIVLKPMVTWGTSISGNLQIKMPVKKVGITRKWWGKHHWYYTRRTVLDVRHMYINKAKFDVSTIHHRIHLVIWTETNMDPTSNNIWLDLAIRNSDLACAS